MSAFAPPATAPAVVHAYHEARAVWERIAFSGQLEKDTLFGGREYADYIHADCDLAEALRGQGGEWVLWPLTYRLTRRGIEIHRTFPETEIPDPR